MLSKEIFGYILNIYNFLKIKHLYFCLIKTFPIIFPLSYQLLHPPIQAQSRKEEGLKQALPGGGNA